MDNFNVQKSVKKKNWLHDVMTFVDIDGIYTINKCNAKRIQ